MKRAETPGTASLTQTADSIRYTARQELKQERKLQMKTKHIKIDFSACSEPPETAAPANKTHASPASAEHYK